MNKKKAFLGIWLMLMTLVSLMAYTMYFVAQMRFSVLLYSYSALTVTQLFALITFLVGSEKIKRKFVKIIYRLCILVSLAVIPAFIFIFSGLMSQYHADVKEAVAVSQDEYDTMLAGKDTLIYETDKLYVFFPKYSRVELTCGKRPSKRDTSITWCSGAAFQHSIELGFSQENVEGYHAVCGEYYDSPYINEACGAVVFYEGGFDFEFEDMEGAIKEAAAKGGSGFMQFRLMEDGQKVNAFTMPRVRSYRAIAELNGDLCIIDSIEMMHFEDFLDALCEIGVTDALYMDMGAGWNYSWYRTEAGRVKELFGLKVPWSHNWVVFKE